MGYLLLMPNEWPGEILRNRREALKLSTRAVARLAGVSQAAIGQYERGDANLANARASTLKGLSFALEWSLEDLQKITGIDFGLQETDFHPDRALPIGYFMMPLIGQAQGGSTETYPVPNGIKRRPGTRAFIVSGDSMAPTIQDGDALLVDTNMTNIQKGKVYVLEVIGNGFCVKRVREIDGAWILDSDNPAHGLYRPEEVNIVGQVYKRLPAAEDVR